MKPILLDLSHHFLKDDRRLSSRLMPSRLRDAICARGRVAAKANGKLHVHPSNPPLGRAARGVGLDSVKGCLLIRSFKLSYPSMDSARRLYSSDLERRRPFCLGQLCCLHHIESQVEHLGCPEEYFAMLYTYSPLVDGVQTQEEDT